MAGTKEIQTRMKSIQDTMKITNAMYMISSSKMKRAKKVLADTEPYFFGVQTALDRILRHLPDEEKESRYLDERTDVSPEDRKRALIVVTADKGLNGAYNHNIIKMAEEELEKARPHKALCTGRCGPPVFLPKRSGYGRKLPLHGAEADHAQVQDDYGNGDRGLPKRRV